MFWIINRVGVVWRGGAGRLDPGSGLNSELARVEARRCAPH